MFLPGAFLIPLVNKQSNFDTGSSCCIKVIYDVECNVNIQPQFQGKSFFYCLVYLIHPAIFQQTDTSDIMYVIISCLSFISFIYSFIPACPLHPISLNMTNTDSLHAHLLFLLLLLISRHSSETHQLMNKTKELTDGLTDRYSGNGVLKLFLTQNR